MIGERDIFSKDIRKCGVAVFALERGCPVQHLVDQNAQGPPIDCTRMSASLDHLGGNIFFGAHERVGSEVGNARFGVDRWQ